MTILGVREFENLLNNNNTGLIVGNGFSMNFDKSFSNLYGSLKRGTDILLRKENFKVSPAAKPKTKKIIKNNYYNILRNIRFFTQRQLEEVFEDGIHYAEFVIKTDSIVEFLKQNRHLNKMSVAPDMVEVTREIYTIANQKGFLYVNIENWPVLIWIYYLIKERPEFDNFKKKPNQFIKMLQIGENVIDSEGTVMSNTRFNGFSIYYRLLMITNIFNDGKAVDVDLLDNMDELDTLSISKWLSSFKHLYSLNYDLILEKVSGREVTYLHGNFHNKAQGYAFFQSYSLVHKRKRFYTSNILLGDYTTTKVLDGFMYKTAFRNHAFTEPYVDPLEKLQSNMVDADINHITMFGLNPENDYHILSGICYQFIVSNTLTPMVTFCYYDESEMEFFKETWNHVTKTIYSHKAEYIKSIEINYLDSKKIINKYFKKNQTAFV